MKYCFFLHVLYVNRSVGTQYNCISLNLQLNTMIDILHFLNTQFIVKKKSNNKKPTFCLIWLLKNSKFLFHCRDTRIWELWAFVYITLKGPYVINFLHWLCLSLQWKRWYIRKKLLSNQFPIYGKHNDANFNSVHLFVHKL